MEIHALNSVNGFDHNRPLITEPCRRQGDSGFRLGNELFSYVIRRDNVSNIDEMSPPFEDTASATDVAVHIISELDVRVDQVGTHFFVDFTLMNSESFSLMFSAPVLYLLLDYLET
jgi:hypothetical protein